MKYALSGHSEAERQRIQSRAWEPEAGIMLDRIGVQTGWSCVDLGCGAGGIIGPLCRRIGTEGKVVGIDFDSDLLGAAGEYVAEQGLVNVELFERDIFDNGLPRAAFDFVHARWILTHVSEPEALIREMAALAKRGGIVAIQEPDHVSMNYYPVFPEWLRLREILESLVNLKSDANIGRRAFKLLREAGLQDVRIRASVLAFRDSHPYMRMPLLAVKSARNRIVGNGLSTNEELDGLVEKLEEKIGDPDTVHVSPIAIQSWGVNP